VKTSKLATLLVAAACTFSPPAAAAGAGASNLCERQMAHAAEKHGVPLGVLYAVGLTETGRGDSLTCRHENLAGWARCATR